MSDQLERLNTPIPTRELERRWNAVRVAMESQKIDVLLMQNNNDFMGGYVKYFTDLPATNGYPVTVTFPRDDRMSMIMQGAFGMDQPLPPSGDPIRRGIRRILGTPSYASAGYSVAYEAELAEKALAAYAGATIGLVGLGTMPVSMIDRLRTRFASARFVDASDLVDRVKVIKSDDEIALIRRTAALQDAAIEAALKAVAPGKREIEIAAVAEHVVLDGGGEQGLFLCCSYTPGFPVPHANRHFQNRAMQKGDMFSLLVESNGPGGFYTETSRTIVLGRATEAMKEELAIVIAARKNTLAMLKPGVSCADIWESHNSFMREHGRPEEHRLYCHGQGYDLVERPLVRHDEPLRIEQNMNIVCHPGYVGRGFLNGICDNYLIGSDGATERLHQLPEELWELEL